MDTKMDSEMDEKITKEPKNRKSNNEVKIPKKVKVVTRASNRRSKLKSPCNDIGSDAKPIRKNVDVGITTKEIAKKNEKKIRYHYVVDLSEMAERNTINVANFKNYLRDRFKNDGKIENLANTVTVEEEQWSVIVKSEIFFKKSVLKYHSKKYLKFKKLRSYVQVVWDGNLNYRFTYYKEPRQ